jgi:predicted dehydrogenase
MDNKRILLLREVPVVVEEESPLVAVVERLDQLVMNQYHLALLHKHMKYACPCYYPHSNQPRDVPTPQTLLYDASWHDFDRVLRLLSMVDHDGVSHVYVYYTSIQMDDHFHGNQRWGNHRQGNVHQSWI